MITKKGTVTKIKRLTHANSPLVYFKLDDTNCLIARHALNFLADVDEGMTVIAAGSLNKRNQFVVHQYSVQGQTKIMIDFAFSNYPHRKV